ncbi:MAG: bifunctional phosphoribosylaminoimidazolecarboxamide formyltransferase/IMP cyclohydrolase [Pseudomonadota bacterium]
MTSSPLDPRPLRRALLSVSDKTGVVALAQALAARGVTLLSTGGTAQALRDAGLTVTDVASVTGFPEIMEGRVKTLHPNVHGGLLAKRDAPTHMAQADEHGIAMIDLLVVNLYPFEATLRAGADTATVIENIDVGGPAMIRAAAKNHANVTVVVDPADYAVVLANLGAAQDATDATEAQGPAQPDAAARRRLAHKAFARTAAYDGAISNWLGTLLDAAASEAMASSAAVADAAPAQATSFGETLTLQWRKAQDLRYGENPHQAAAFYVARASDHPDGTLAGARQLSGKALSYNNIADSDAALACVRAFTAAPACVIVKHANPCGVALNPSLAEAYDRAFRTDPESAFGGIIAFNRALDLATAQAIIERQFVEVIIAPDIDEGVAQAVARKKNVRLLVCGSLDDATDPSGPPRDLKPVSGGLLVQDPDGPLHGDLNVVTKRAPSEREHADLLFAWTVAKFVKSNAIIYARDLATVGVGAGQMSRINASRIAALKAEMAGLEIKGAAVASDAFFPFADGMIAAADEGATCIIQPGGSMRDDEVIEAADARDLAMVFTSMRHFRH